MSLTTKNIATVVFGVALVVTLSFAFATPAKAQSIAELQAMVNQLLAQIAALTGGSSGGTCNTFTRNHQMGDSGGEVKWIQQFLNSHGSQVSATGAGSPGNESDYFGAKTKAAVAKWQAANGVSPAAGYWGPITRTKANSMCTPGPTPGVPGVPVTGNGLKVMLAADSPTNATLVQGQGTGEVAKFTFSNPTAAEITVTSIGFKRTGASSDSTITNVFLFNGPTRLTDAAGLSNAMFTFNDTTGIFKVPAGGSITVSVRMDITASTGGSTIGAQIVSVASSGTLDSSVVLPISGSNLLISSASMGTLAFTYTGPTGATENPGNDIRVFEAQGVVSTHAGWLQSVGFENRGSTDDDDLKNMKLFIDGVQVGSTVDTFVKGKLTFDLSAAPKRLETGTRIFKVVADVVGGSGKTYDIQIRRAADVRFIDVELNQPIMATDSNSFPSSAASVNTVGAASLSVVRASSSPTSNVAVDATNVLWAKFEFRASGDNVKVEAITVDTDTTNNDGLDNGKVFLNGVQIGSTNDVAEAGTSFSFGSSFIARQGQTEIVEIYADGKDDDGGSLSNGQTVDVGVSVAAADTEGMDSGDRVSAISEVEGFSRTISSSTLTMSKSSGYGDQTLVAGANNQKVGSFTLSAGSTEGVNVNTITVTLSSAESSSISDLMLKRNDTGAQVGTTKVSPSTSNSFSTNLTVPQSGTVTIDLYANLKSGNGASLTFVANVDGSGTGATTASSVTFGSSSASSGSLQTITIAGSGTLTVTRDAGTPVNSNVVAGLTNVHVGKFDFAAVSSSFTVQELKVKVLTDSATSVSAVTLKYKNAAGVEQTVSTALSLPTNSTDTHATATFTGLTMHVPNNDSADLDVYVDIPTTTSGAKSGVGITVLVDADEGFKASDAGGTQDTSAASSDVNSAANSGYGTKYVKKTIPTIARLSTGYTANTVAAGIGLYRFTITADAAGAVEWRKLSFEITTSGVDVQSGWTLYDVTGTATAVNSNATSTNQSAATAAQVLAICPGSAAAASACAIGEAETVGAGSTKTYELRTSTVTGWGNSGDSLVINFKEDTSAVVNTTAVAQHNTNTSHMIWSDRSASSHATTTSDWTNGYLVKDLDNDTRSCQFGSSTICTP